MNVDVTEDNARWASACTVPSFVALRSDRLRLISILLAIYLGCYLGLALLCGFARSWLGTPVLGALNLGYALILANYLVAWVLALIYVWRANRRYDALAAAAITEHTATLQRSIVSQPAAALAP